MAFSEQKIQSAISSIDWNFEDALSNYSLHKLHWYPGTFVPQIPAYLIELLSAPGDLVYDPFCGVGTTLVESVRLGRRAIGIDVNPVATLIAKTKTFFIEDETLRDLEAAFLSRLDTSQASYRLFGDAPLLAFRASAKLRKMALPFESLRAWYHEATFYELLLIRTHINEESGPFRRIMDVAFSQMLRGLSGPRHWGWVADNVIPKETHYAAALQMFRQNLVAFSSLFREFRSNPQIRRRAVRDLNSLPCVVRADVRQGSPLQDGVADLVVTSPPYVNVTDYTTAQRLTLEWLKLDLPSLKDMEVGARWKRFRQGAVKDYFEEMETCLSNTLSSLRCGGYFCLVLGEGQHRGSKVDVVNTLRSMMERSGVVMAFPEIVRTPSRQRLRNRRGATHNEHILIFRKL